MNRVPAKFRDVGLATRRCAIVAGLMISALAAPTLSEASPMTWLYTGSVTSTFDNVLVPLGSPVTTLLTADPAANVVAGNVGCNGAHPEGGAYLFNALITIMGQQYDYFAALEVNYDFTNCSNNFAGVRIVPFTLSGPSIGPGFPPPGGQGNQQGAYSAGGIFDPSSPAFPSSSDLSLLLRLAPLDRANVRISATDPHVVPEPATLFLLGTGLAGTVARRRFQAPR